MNRRLPARRLQLLVVAGAACLSVPVGGARADDWVSQGLSADHARLSRERSGASFDAAAWQHQVPAGSDPVYRALFASPAVADGFVVYGTQLNQVGAVEERSGKPLWLRQVGGVIVASPLLWRGWAFVLGANRQLYALRLVDGSVVWQTDVGGIGSASPTLLDGRLYVGVGQPSPRVFCIEAATGKTIWQAGETRLHQAVSAAPVVAGGRVLVAETGGAYHSFAAADGQWQWTTQVGGTVAMSAPVVLDARVYLLPGGESAALHALDLATGSKLDGWPLPIPAVGPGLEGRTLLRRAHVVSSLAGAGDLVAFSVRFDERFAAAGDGLESRLSRELVVAVDVRAQRVVWSTPVGRLESPDPTRFPTHEFSSTPALYRNDAGEILLAAASSLEATLRVLGGLDGGVRWSKALSARTRSSPLFANGRLLVATDAGILESFGSSTNEAPVAAILGMSPASGESVAGPVTLRWGAAFDNEAEVLRYQVRLDDDGEVLHDWDVEITSARAEQAALVTDRLWPGRLYAYAVRAQDARGALSAWSRVETFRVLSDVRVDGVAAANLGEAVAAARPGSSISLGAGTWSLPATLVLPAGVSLTGAAPHLTVLEGKGLAVAITPGAGGELAQLTVTGAQVGVSIGGGGAVRLRNLVVRDNPTAGVEIGVDGQADLVNLTIARNGVGVRAFGRTAVRNTLVGANAVGIQASRPELVTSRYNDVFGSHTVDWDNAKPDATDLASVVDFETGTPEDLRLAARQPTTDRGDPSDGFEREPLPNGARINIGAFGNTAFAELSGDDLIAEPGPERDAGASHADASEPPADISEAPPRDAGSCGCRVGGSGQQGAFALPWLLAALAALLGRGRGRRR